MTPPPRDWHVLAEQASKETDPNKLMTIIKQLNGELEREEAFRRTSRRGPF